MTGSDNTVFLYVPRLHNNMVGLCEHLDANYSLKIIQISPYKHSSVKSSFNIIDLEESSLSRIIGRIIGYGGKSLPYKFSSTRSLFRLLIKNPKNFIFLRGLPRASTLQVLLLSLVCKIRICIIEQINIDKLSHPLSQLWYYLNIIRILNHHVVTQIQDPCLNKKRNHSVSYIPFIMPSDWLTCNLNNKMIRHEQTDATFRILTIGKFGQKRKNIHEICNAVSYLIDRGYKINLSVVGQGDNQDIEKLRSIYPSITFYLNESSEYIRMLFDNVDIFILPSDKEPASYSIYESICRGVPAVCTSDNGTSDIIKLNGCGYIMNFYSPNKVDNLCRFLDNLMNSHASLRIWSSSTFSAMINHCNPYPLFQEYQKNIESYFEK